MIYCATMGKIVPCNFVLDSDVPKKLIFILDFFI